MHLPRAALLIALTLAGAGGIAVAQDTAPVDLEVKGASGLDGVISTPPDAERISQRVAAARSIIDAAFAADFSGEIMVDMGVTDIDMVGVAKGIDRDAGKEEFYRTGQRPFALKHNDPVLYFVQRLRDEAHRFAIGTHRAKRAKAIGATPLDDVPGVGATRKRALLAHFGSAKAVGRANLADLKAVDGISDAMAETIYDYFHERG